MKLAEALQERADINIRLKQLERRMANCALVQEGESLPRIPKLCGGNWTRASTVCNTW